MSPECTVCIPVYNNPEGCKDLISDFYRVHSKEIDKFRFIVLDQTKEGIQFNKEEPVHLHIKAYKNLGFSKAVNQMWKLVTTPYTLLANDDVRLIDPRWYEGARQFLDHDGLLGSNPFPATRTWDKHGNVVWYWDQMVDDADGPTEERDKRFDFIKGKDFDDYTPEDYDKLMEIHGGSIGNGTAMFFTLLRTDARHHVGLLDEKYWNNGEDYDWNRRCFLTCWHCWKRKHEHNHRPEVNGGRGIYLCPEPHTTSFEPCRIITCKESLVHHQAGVTKQKAEAQEGASTLDTVVMAKSIFNGKWNIKKEGPTDIYGDNGTPEPSMPWWSEIPL